MATAPESGLKMTPALREHCKKLMDKLRSHMYAGPFLAPVDPVALGIPDYLDVIKNPMDLGTVNKKLRDKSGARFYPVFEPFVADLRLVFSNCLLYNNGPGDYQIRDMATTLSKIAEKFIADVYANPDTYGTVDVGGGAATGTPGKKRPRMAAGVADADDTSETASAAAPAPHTAALAQELEPSRAKERGKGKKRSEPESLAAEFNPGTPQHTFWRAVEATWDDLQLVGANRKLPVMGNKLLDLFELYQRVMRFGGYDVVNGTKGGWAAVFKGMPMLSSSESSASFRVKRVYERMVLEYERRMAAGWNPDSGDHTVLTAGHTPPAAGVGVPEEVATRNAAGLARLRLAMSSEAAIAPGPGEAPILPGLPPHMQGRIERGAAPVMADASGSTAVVVGVTARGRKPSVTPTVAFGVQRTVRITAGRTDAAVTGLHWPLLRYLSISPQLGANMVYSTMNPPHVENADRAAPEVVDDAVWIRERTKRVLSQLEYALPMEATGHARSTRAHTKQCIVCGTHRRATSALATAHAAAGRDTSSDATLSSPSHNPSSDAPLNRAWALCATCPNAACLNCLLPTPEAAGLSSAAEYTAMLASSAEASAKFGACSREGDRLGISDVGLWLCHACASVQTASVGHTPWCNFCCGPLAAPPRAARDASFFGGAVAFTASTKPPELKAGAPGTGSAVGGPAVSAPPATAHPHTATSGATLPAAAAATAQVAEDTWPRIVRCEECSIGMHGLCAFRSGAVVAEAEDRSRVGETTGTRHAFYCRICAGIIAKPGATRLPTRLAPGSAPSIPPGPPLVHFGFAPTRETVVLGRLL